MTEDQFQAELFTWAWNTLPETRRLLWAVPNGGWRNPAQVKLLQATGVIAGVFDLHFLWRGVLYVFELKVGVNRLSAPQIAWRELVAGHGAMTYVIHEAHGGRELFKSRMTEICGAV